MRRRTRHLAVPVEPSRPVRVHRARIAPAVRGPDRFAVGRADDADRDTQHPSDGLADGPPDAGRHAPPEPEPDAAPHATPNPPNATTHADRRPHPGAVAAEHPDPTRLPDPPEIALTFDMGGRVGDALAIVDWLVAHDVHATVFMTGAMAANRNTDARPGGPPDRRRPPGRCSRSATTHTLTAISGTLTAAEIRDELRRTEAAVAPFCSSGTCVRSSARRAAATTPMCSPRSARPATGRRSLWDIDTIDWRPIVNDPPGTDGRPDRGQGPRQ